jgi:ppGpp synthetase/RelA/SpoT-type nucleotidyltranferase
MDKVEYEKATRPHARALRQLLLDFEFFIADAGSLNVFSVTGRIKSLESASEKERRIGIPMFELQDLAGIRVVLATSDEVDVFATFLKDAENRKRLKIAIDRQIEHETGYRSRHIIVEVGSDVTHSVYDVKVEVQLQTIMEHAFNFVSRAWVYKTERAYTPEWQEQFTSISRSLRDLDFAISKLHQDVLESAARGGDREPLTPFSFQRIVKEEFAEEVSLDESVWSTRFLIDMGITTNGELRAFFRRPDLLALRQRLRDAKGRVRETLGGLCDMSAHSFFTFWGVRQAAAEELLRKLAEDLPNQQTPN